MKKDIKFSITVPAYKARFLKDCIESVLAQTYQDYELIIVNDGSPEDLDSIVQQFHDERIRYYKNKIGFGGYNLVFNWNKCLEYCTGQYVICMGDDDRLLPNCLENYAALIERYPGKGVYHTRAEVINENNEIIRMCEARADIESVYSFIWSELSLYNHSFIGDYLFEVETLRDNGGFFFLPYAWHSDRLSVCIAAIKSGMATTNIPGFQYRSFSQTISHSTNNTVDKMTATQRCKDWYEDFLQEKPKDEMDVVFRDLSLKLLPSYIQSVKYLDMRHEMENNYSRVFFWYRNAQHFQISKKNVVMAFLRNIKDKLLQR